MKRLNDMAQMPHSVSGVNTAPCHPPVPTGDVRFRKFNGTSVLAVCFTVGRGKLWVPATTDSRRQSTI